MSRMIASMLSVLVLFAAAPGARADDDPKDILKKAIKAHGGEEFLNKHPAARAQNKGKIDLPGLGEAEFTQDVAYFLPDKFKDTMELSVAGQKVSIVTILNGKSISIEAGGKAVDINDNIKKSINEAIDMMAMARLTPLLKDKNYELSLFGEAKVEDKPAVGVRISAKGKKDVTIFFDKKTNLMVKIEHRTTDPNTGNEINQERIMLEYKEKDGIQIPKKVLVKHDGKKFIEAESTEFTFLEKIDDNEFKK